VINGTIGKTAITPKLDRPIVPAVLRESWELVGPLDLVEPYGDGLIHVRVAGLDELVSDELEGKLRPLIGLGMAELRTFALVSFSHLPLSCAWFLVCPVEKVGLLDVAPILRKGQTIFVRPGY
jgi:hypothetical protein